MIIPFGFFNQSSAGLVESIISYWNFNSNSNDQVGSNNGTDTTISYVAGKISNAADFTATSSKITVSDADNLSFGNGSTDVPFSVSLWVNFDTIKYTNLFDKRSASGSEYQLYYDSLSNKLVFRLFEKGIASIYVLWAFSWTPSTGTWYNLIITYNGSVNGDGGVVSPEDAVKIYLNGVVQTVVADSIIGGGDFYECMSNTTASFNIGYLYVTTSFTLDGKTDEMYVFSKKLTATESEFVYDEGIAGRTLI